MLYSFIVGLLTTVLTQKYIKSAKTVGLLIGILSYLYNRNASQLDNQ